VGNLTVSKKNANSPDVNITATVISPGVDSRFNGLVIAGKSKIRGTITATPKGGASIIAYRTVVAAMYNYDTPTFETPILEWGASIQTNVYDSNGNMTYARLSVPSYPSNPPTITTKDERYNLAYRCDDDGNPLENGTKVKLNLKCITSVVGEGINLNDVTVFQYRYAEKNNSSPAWGDWINLSLTDGTYYQGVLSDTFDKEKLYVFEFYAEDRLKNNTDLSTEVASEVVTIHFRDGGRAMAIGGYADETKNNVFNVRWESYFDKPINGTVGGKDVVGSILNYAYSCPDGVTFCKASGSYYTPDIPNDRFQYSPFIVIKANSIIHIFGFASEPYDGSKRRMIATNANLFGTWYGWKYLDDISN